MDPFSHTPFDRPDTNKKLPEKDLYSGWHGGVVDIQKLHPQPIPTSTYLERTRRDNPEPLKLPVITSAILSDCRFVTQELCVSEPFEMTCAIQGDRNATPVTFHLICSYPDDQGQDVVEELGNFQSSVVDKSGPIPTVTVTGTLYRPNTPLGITLHYKLSATHPKAISSADSALVDVVAKVRVWSQPLRVAHFQPGGMVPILDDHGLLPRLLASVLQEVGRKEADGTRSYLTVQGHATDAGDSAHSVELSRWRAQLVRSILSRQEGLKTWSEIACAHGTSAEFQATLKALAQGYRWDCDDDDPIEAVKGFQSECNGRFWQRLEEDGILGDKTWVAMHRALCSLVQEEIGEDPTAEAEWVLPVWSTKVDGVFGWGGNAPSTDDPEGRTLDICLHKMDNPGVQKVPEGVPPALEHNVLEDAGKVEKRPLDQKPQPKPKFVSGSNPKLAMRFPFDLAIRGTIKKGYHEGGKRFGSAREHGKRTHAGCDLIAPVGTPIYAVADGTFVNYKLFYSQTYAIVIDHGDFTVRYGEVQPPYHDAVHNWKSDAPPESQSKGMAQPLVTDQLVKRGQLLGWVGQLRDKNKKTGKMQDGYHMLHFELYKNTAKGELTVIGNSNYDHVPKRKYQRRRDLLNPTQFLDEADDA